MTRCLATTAIWLWILGGAVMPAAASPGSRCELQHSTGRRGPNDGLECNGNLVLIGDSKGELLSKCGAPLREERYFEYNACIDLWIYQRGSGSFPREVRLVNDRVCGIRALSRLPPSLDRRQTWCRVGREAARFGRPRYRSTKQ